MVPLKTKLTKKTTYGFATIFVLVFVFWIMYANYQAQVEIKLNAIQRAEDSFKTASKNMTSFLLQCQNDIKGFALDRTIRTFFENKALGMSMQYGLLVSLNNIKRQLGSFQQHHTLEDKTIFPRLLFQDNHGHKLVEKKTPEFNNTSGKNTIHKIKSPPDHIHISHDKNYPDYLTISAPCIFKKRIAGHLIAWIPYHILFDQFLRTSELQDVERFFLVTNNEPSKSIIVPFSQTGSPSISLEKINQSILNQINTFICTSSKKHYLIFIDKPTQLPFEVIKLLLKQKVLGTYNPKILFSGMLITCLSLFISVVFLIRANIKQQINDVILFETIEQQQRIKEKNRELKIANEMISASRREAVAEREQLNITLRSIGDGVITTDLNNKIVLINEVAETLTGWNQEEALGKSMVDVFNIIDEKTGHPCANPLNKVLTSGKIVTLEEHTILIARNGTHRNIADSAAPIIGPEGDITGIILVFRDITKEKRYDAELLKIKKLESVGVLAGGIAHDFNNILTVILGNINLAETYLDPDNKAADLLQKAEKASHRAKELTQQLLTFSRGGDPVKETTFIKEVIIESANFILLGSKVACHFSIPEDLWLVDIDTGQMSQVIQNITMNARNAMPKGGKVTIKCSNISDITIDSDLAGISNMSYIKITIKDNGDGIPEHHIDKIFDPYFSTWKGGSGLGLAITHSIIKKHAGHIFVESQPSKGAVFTIYLPASKNKQSPEQPVKKVTLPRSNCKARILIMDDEQHILNLVEKMLGHLGHEAIMTKDGKEAIAVFKEHLQSDQPIDMIIMDLTIPGGMGGKDAIIDILKINPKAKVVVSSGYSNSPVMADYQKHGFKAAIAKPYKLSELQEIINAVLA